MSFANDIFLIQYSRWDHYWWLVSEENFQSLEWLCPDKKWLYYRKKIFLTGKENNLGKHLGYENKNNEEQMPTEIRKPSRKF